MLLMVRVNVTNAFIKGLIFHNLILVFEFLLVFLDPYIESYSGEQPLMIFRANFVLALVVFPIHQYIQAFAEKHLLQT